MSVLDIPQPTVIILARCGLYFYQAENAACFIQARYRKPRVNDHAIHGNQLSFLDSTSKATLTLVNYFTSGRAFLHSKTDFQHSAVKKGRWCVIETIICLKKKLLFHYAGSLKAYVL